MKMIFVFALMSSYAFAATNVPKKNLPINKTEEFVKKDQAKTKEPNTLDKKPEDCDDKAKKPVEITPESISLSGTTGCSLDQAHP